MLEGLFFIVIFCSVIVGVPIIGVLLYKNKKYKNTAYYKITQNRYSDVKHDKGKLGEYLIYKRLKKLENSGGKFLFNVYIPKGDGHDTEIDVLLICKKGVLVFESKNLGGSICGNEAERYWRQSFHQNHEDSFYNPIKQNNAHIEHLKKLIGDYYTRSIIVFSDECSLENVAVSGSDVWVVQHKDLLSVVNQMQNVMLTGVNRYIKSFCHIQKLVKSKKNNIYAALPIIKIVLRAFNQPVILFLGLKPAAKT